ncbi:MAG: beta-L-arabinofuranosidase domain-containing protein [Galbibacter orientalis]|uniref:glycoside hydrolase family 127 protein n=1 Tax=Galbibacter orientalis TaxID=453852 RepID=UPI003001EF75
MRSLRRIDSTILVTFSLLLLFSCQQESQKEGVTTKIENESGYQIESVNIQHVKLNDDFWLPIIERVQERTIEYAIEKSTEEGRFDNFLIAGGKMEGEVKGVMPFDDTDVYKIVEGASYSLISAPNPQLETLLDSIINVISIGQEKDGYLTTWRTINPAHPPATWVKVNEGKRWESLEMSHELYNAGHLYEAAAAHYEATGKKNFLNIALKNADLMVETFGPEDGKIHTVPGHQIIETGLIRLYRITNEKKYLELAKYFLDGRGFHEGRMDFGPYAQDHVPVIKQDEVVGHAVRAVYMYAAMTDIAAIENDTAYHKAVDNLWENMVNKKMYLTGGIGARHEGEAFGENYELPNLTAYNETCAAIGDVYWNHRLHNMTGNVKYFDVIERTLYNGLISGLSLNGTQFFYPNALESDGVYKFNQGACTRKDWFDCSCCPTNVIRFIPSLPGLIYSKTSDTVFVNLYAANQATIGLEKTAIAITQETSYPWNGSVKLTVTPETASDFTIKLRIPGWARNEVLPGTLYSYKEKIKAVPEVKVNGELVEATIDNGYITLTRNWKKGETISLEIPMKVREVLANEKVEEDRGKIALEYGPIVYAVEEIDNKNNFDAITISNDDTFQVKKENDLLEGVNVIENNKLKAIPYYAWSNRGIGKMKVWLPKK